jgi:hypothetical protein
MHRGGLRTRAQSNLAGVSIAVALEEIPAKLADYRWCYLLTTGDDRPHALAVTPTVIETGLRCKTGNSSRANVARSPLVVMIFPAQQADGMSLLIDGEAEVDGDGIVVRPTWAVLHRSAIPSRTADVEAES